VESFNVRMHHVLVQASRMFNAGMAVNQKEIHDMVLCKGGTWVVWGWRGAPGMKVRAHGPWEAARVVEPSAVKAGCVQRKRACCARGERTNLNRMERCKQGGDGEEQVAAT